MIDRCRIAPAQYGHAMQAAITSFYVRAQPPVAPVTAAGKGGHLPGWVGVHIGEIMETVNSAGMAPHQCPRAITEEEFRFSSDFPLT